MAPSHLRGAAVVAAAPEFAHISARALARRGLEVNHTQAVTLGVIGAYVVAIALLWNLPYVRWILWPFKVRASLPPIRSPLLPLPPGLPSMLRLSESAPPD